MTLSYKNSGVDYNLLDPVKKIAQREGLKTRFNLNASGFKEVVESRGETAYILETDDCYFAFVVEGLGTKNLIADAMQKITGKTYYGAIGYDTVISITMDLVSVGAKPSTILSYWAVGDSSWFGDEKRLMDFIKGWKRACDDVGATWGGGETPTLKDIIYSNTIDLGGAAFGIIKPKKRLVLKDKLQSGDVIILFESSGIHVNGLTLARKLAEKLPSGFASKLSDGKMYGEELLIPTLNYSRLVADLFRKEIDIHYMVNITGHGWRKLMRAKKNFSYIIDTIPPVPEIFKFIQKQSRLSDREMYATFNMGAGFAVFVAEKDAKKVTKLSKNHKIKAWVAGTVQNGPKKVIMPRQNITYNVDDLQIR